MAVGGCLSAVCRFISDFMRLILFFVSIVFMMLSVFLFAKSFQGKDTFDAIQVANANSCFLVILALATYLIALSVFGIHATFFRHGMMIEWSDTLRKFSLLAGMNVLLGLAVFIYTAPRLSDSSMNVDSRLRELQPDYDWSALLKGQEYHDKPDANWKLDNGQLDATRKWDNIQLTYQCCGVQSPADWLPFRPKNRTDQYPASCCGLLVENKICTEDNIWTNGCVSEIKAANNRLSLSLTALIFMNCLLSVLANLVICCHPKQDYLVI